MKPRLVGLPEAAGCFYCFLHSKNLLAGGPNVTFFKAVAVSLVVVVMCGCKGPVARLEYTGAIIKK